MKQKNYCHFTREGIVTSIILNGKYLLEDAEEEAFLDYENYMNGEFDDTLGPLN